MKIVTKFHEIYLSTKYRIQGALYYRFILTNQTIKFDIDLAPGTYNSLYSVDDYSSQFSQLGISTESNYAIYIVFKKVEPNTYSKNSKYAMMSSEYTFYISDQPVDDEYNVKSNDSVGIIVGSVVGGLAFIILIIIICCCCCKSDKNKTKTKKKENKIEFSALTQTKVAPPQPVQTKPIHIPNNQYPSPNHFPQPQNPQTIYPNRQSNPLPQNINSPNIRPYSQTQPNGPHQYSGNQMQFAQPNLYPGQNMQMNEPYMNRPSNPSQMNRPSNPGQMNGTFGGEQFYQVGGNFNRQSYGQGNQRDPFSLQPNEELDLPMYEIDMKKQ